MNPRVFPILFLLLLSLVPACATKPEVAPERAVFQTLPREAITASNVLEKGVPDHLYVPADELSAILAQLRYTYAKLQELKTQPGETGKLVRLRLQELQREENACAVRFYNEFVDGITWQNFLDAQHISNWFKAGPVEFTFEGGQMNAKSTTARGSKDHGIVLSGKRDFWIDFDLEFEVEIKKEGFILVGRYSGPQASFQLPFESGGQFNPIAEGHIYKCFVSAVGGEIMQRIEMWDSEANGWKKIDLEVYKYLMPRAAHSGAFGFGIMPGGEVTFRSIRARIVRAD